ncbi:MAG TPA: hypothetical protein VHZ97_18855 [Pseudonocardiaceae bacterium]|nr:hypothetical protein [Pseudonocardiaceae bacterium]
MLQHLDRKSELVRERLANDPVTAAYLAAAVRLVRRQLGPEIDPTMPKPQGENNVDRPLLGFLSQRHVAEEVEHNPFPFPVRGTTAAMRDRWKLQSHFLADLVSFVLWTAYYPEQYKDVVANGAENLVRGVDFAQAVVDFTYRVCCTIASSVAFRLQLVAIATINGDDALRQALTGKYRRGVQIWSQVYADFIEARGLRLRPGISLTDFTNILTAMLEGLMIREISDPDTMVIDNERGYALLSTAALALINGCLEPAEHTDGRSLIDAVNDLVRRAKPTQDGEQQQHQPSPGEEVSP